MQRVQKENTLKLFFPSIVLYSWKSTCLINTAGANPASSLTQCLQAACVSLGSYPSKTGSGLYPHAQDLVNGCIKPVFSEVLQEMQDQVPGVRCPGSALLFWKCSTSETQNSQLGALRLYLIPPYWFIFSIPESKGQHTACSMHPDTAVLIKAEQEPERSLSGCVLKCYLWTGLSGSSAEQISGPESQCHCGALL